jgi:fluoride exporter
VVRFLLICLAGAAGTGARYLTMLWAERAFGPTFPWGTLIVNLVGSFLIAMVTVVTALLWPISPTARLAIMTGFLGGLTTYSTFNQDTYRLLSSRAYGVAAAYAALTIVSCLAAGWFGHVIARRL